MKLISLLLFLALFSQTTYCIIGTRVFDLNSNALAIYMKFGFLNKGTISNAVSLTQRTYPNSFVYFLVCDGDSKEDFVNYAKGKNVCTAPNLRSKMQECSLMHIAFNDEDGNTRILPFSSLEFLDALVSFNNITDSTKSTAISDYSTDNFFDSYQGGFEEPKLSFLRDVGSSKSGDSQETRGLTGNSSDNDGTSTNQTVFLDKIMTLWFQYENLTAWESPGNSLGISTYESLESLGVGLRSYLGKSVAGNVTHSGTYYFLTLNCESSTHLSIDYSVMNPGGEHLSAGDIGNKGVFYAMIFSWGFLFLFWCGTWLSNILNKRRTYALQYTLIIVDLVCFVFTVIERVYWETYSETGESPLALKILGAFFQGFVLSFFLGLFLLIGKGYTYINLALTTKDKRDIAIFIFVRYIFSWLMEFFEDQILIIAILALGYLFAIFVIYKDFKRNIQKIEFVLDTIEHYSPPNNNRGTQPIQADPPNNNNNQVQTQAQVEEIPVILTLDQVLAEENLENFPQVVVAQEGTAVVTDAERGLVVRQEREPVRNFDRDIKMLKAKLQAVKILRIFIILHIGILCMAYIIELFVLSEKSFALNLWTQVLLAISFFVITWFFNYKYKLAFIYSNLRDFDEELEPAMRRRRKHKRPSSLLDLKDLHPIAGDFVIIEEEGNQKLKLASRMITKPQAQKLEPKKEEESTTKTRIKFTQKELRAQRKAWKYRVNDSAFHECEEEVENKDQIVPKTDHYLNKQTEPAAKYLHLNDIDLNFEDEQQEQNSLVLEFNEGGKEGFKDIEKLYPKPKQLPPKDYRKQLKNESFHN